MQAHVSWMVDGVGNIVLAGQYKGTADFDPGAGVAMMTSASNSWSDAFVLKLDGNGEFVWAKTIRGTADIANGACTLDAAGNFYMVGTMYGDADLDPSPTSSAIVQPVLTPGSYVLKWDVNGNYLWGYAWDMHADPTVVAVDNAGNLYAYGEYYFNADLDPTAGVFNVSTGALHSSFVTKLNPNGGFVWAKVLDCTIENFESEMKIDPQGNIVVAGTFTGALDIDPGPGTHLLTSTGGLYDWFVAKMDANGGFLSGFSIGGAGDDHSQGFALDAVGNLYLLGQFEGPVDFDPGLAYNDLQVPSGVSNAYLKYDLSGNLLWGATFGTTGVTSFGGFALDPMGNIYCSGYFRSSVDFDPRAGSTIFTSDAFGDMFLMKLSQDSCSNLALVIDSVSSVTCLSSTYISSHAVNGLPPYSYLWNTSPQGTDSFVTVVGGEIYTVTVTDANGCSTERSVLISAPNHPSGFDLATHIVAGPMRAGVISNLWLDGYNDGCVATSGQMTLVLDSNVTYTNATPPPSNIVGNTLTWTFTNWTADTPHLQPLVEVVPDSALLSGTLLCFDLAITPTQADADTSNNHELACIPVNNSYDPNDKAVSPKGACEEGYIVANQKLTYKVRFQNTGNAEAIKVVVVDSLDQRLDLSTVKVLSSSHTGLITEVMPGNVLRFRFDHIHLPDSASNEAASHGFVNYEAHPVAGLSPGEVIANRAQIYFDFNIAVATNTVHNTVATTIPNIAASITTSGATLVAQPAGATYQWYACDNDLVPISGATGQNFAPTTAGNYAVELRVGTCTALSPCVAFGTVNTEPENLLAAVKLYPNPSQNGQLNLDFGTWHKPVHMQVCNALGAVVHSQSVQPTREYQFELQGPAGLYFVTLRDAMGAQVTWKLIRE